MLILGTTEFEYNMQEWIILGIVLLWAMKLTDAWRHNEHRGMKKHFCHQHFLIVFVSYSLGGWRHQKRIKVCKLITFVDTHSCSFYFLILTRRRGNAMVEERYPFRFFGVEVSCWLQEDIIIDSISFSKLQQQEGCSTARIITCIYSCVWYIRTLQTAVIDSLSPFNVPNKGPIRTILFTVACEAVSCFFLRRYHILSHSHMQISLPFSWGKKVRSVRATLRGV